MTQGDIMDVLFTLCLMGFGLMGFALFVIYQFIKLPVLTNLLYVKYGVSSASGIIEDIAQAVVAVKEATPATPDNSVITTLVHSVTQQITATSSDEEE